MKNKNLLVAIVFFGVILFSVSTATAKVSGPCVDCHTMHFSQTPWPTFWGTSGPNAALLVNDCVGCHSGAAALKGTSNEIPVVLRTVAPSGTGAGKSLAGGDFYWVDAGNSTNGHDVIDLPNISGADGNLGMTPPGWNATATPGALGDGQIAGGAGTWTSQLTCAGTYGCHGRHDVADNAGAVSGGHHGDDSCLKQGTDFNQSAQGADIVTSYRWLGGIEGIEDGDWEWTATDNTNNHNQYKGVSENLHFSNKTTISYLCAECHGDFHSGIGGTASPWLRHPTDIQLPSDTSKEYYAYNGGTGADNPYSVIAPVGSTTFAAGGIPEAQITPGTDDSIVLCISCHRAHGTEYPDLLRWDYDTMIAGQTSTPNEGCFICHTTK